jgi:hypothetical protein
MVSSATLRVLEFSRGVEVDLIGADRKAADHEQPVGGLHHLRRQLGPRADPEHVDARQGLLEFLWAQRLGEALDLAIAVGVEQPHRRIVDALQQQDADLVFRQRQRHRASNPDKRILANKTCERYLRFTSDATAASAMAEIVAISADTGAQPIAEGYRQFELSMKQLERAIFMGYR